MKFKNLPVLLVAIMALGFVFTSCEKEELMTETKNKEIDILTTDESLISEIKVEKGILSFNNFEHLSDFMQILNTMSDKEYLDFIQEKGVTTLYEKLLESLNSEMLEADNLQKNEITATSAENINMGYLTKEISKSGTTIIKPACGIEPLSKVLNLQKVVIIGDEILYYDENTHKRIQNKDFSQIELLEETNTSNDKIIVAETSSKLDQIDWSRGDNFDEGRYRIEFNMNFKQFKYTSSSGTERYQTSYWTSSPSLKKNIFGTYKPHSTTFRIDHSWKMRWTPVNGRQQYSSSGMAGGTTNAAYYWMFRLRDDAWDSFTHTHQMYDGDTEMNTDHVDFTYTHGYTSRLK